MRSFFCFIRSLVQLFPKRWQIRLFNTSVENKEILHGMGLVGGFLLVAKVIAAIKEVLVAQYYGTSAELDGYLFAFNLASWPVSVFFAVISFVLIPAFVRWQNLPQQTFHLFQREGLFLVLLVSFTLASVAFWLLPIIISSENLGLNRGARTAALGAVPTVTLMLFMGMVANWFFAYLMSTRRHVNTLLEASPALLIALALLFAPPTTGSEITPLLWGTVLGFAVQFAFLVLIARSTGIALRPAYPKAFQEWRTLYSALSIILLAQVISTSTGVLDQILLARMPEGNLATYAYAQRVMALVLGLSATVVGRAILPVLSAVNDRATCRRLADQWSRRMFMVGGMGTVLIIVTAKPLISFLFERGAFTPNDTHAVVWTLMALSLQLPFYLSAIVYMQWVGAVGKSRLYLLSVVVGVAFKLAFLALMPLTDSYLLAGSVAVMYAAMTIVIYIKSRLDGHCV